MQEPGPIATYNRRDHFHQRAKREGYRSRAAFKLIEIQKAHRLLRRGMKVIDLGCWPGGWLQVTAAEIGPTGRVVGVDIAPIDPPIDSANTIALLLDLTDPETSAAICSALGGRAELVLSDAAPKLTGIRATDQAREGALLEAVERLLPELLLPGGSLLLKILEGPDAVLVDRRLRGQFDTAKTVKSQATRRGSAERYLLASGYKASTAPADSGRPAK